MTVRRRRSSAVTRNRIVVPGGVIGVGLAVLGAVAFACTGPGGNQSHSTVTSGSSSITASVYALGNQFPASTPGFFWRFAPPNTVTSDQSCHHATTYGASVTSEANGNIGSLVRPTRTWSLGSDTGTGEACWATSNQITDEVARSVIITVTN